MTTARQLLNFLAVLVLLTYTQMRIYATPISQGCVKTSELIQIGKKYPLGTIAKRMVTVECFYRNDGDSTGIDESCVRFVLHEGQKQQYLLDHKICLSPQSKIQIRDFLHKGTKQVLILDEVSVYLMECDGTRIIEYLGFCGKPETTLPRFFIGRHKPRLEVSKKLNKRWYRT